MKFASKIPGILLIAGTLAATLPTNAWAGSNHTAVSSAKQSLGEKASGCHAHALPPAQRSESQLPHSPVTPVSHQCCLAGHNVAAVQLSQAPEPSIQCTGVTPIAGAELISWLDKGEISTALSVDPPDVTPLRI